MAKITKAWGELGTDENGVDKFTVSILMHERPGQPIRLTAKDVFARQLKKYFDENVIFSFEANIAGNPIPYLFVTKLQAC